MEIKNYNKLIITSLLLILVSSANELMTISYGESSYLLVAFGMLWILLITISGYILSRLVIYQNLNFTLIIFILILNLSLYKILLPYINYNFIRPNQRISLGLISILVAYWGAKYIDLNMAVRIGKSVLVGSIIFVIYGYISSPRENYLVKNDVLNIDNISNVNTKANVIIIFDELSYEYDSSLRDILNNAGLNINYKILESAGKNTLNAIPSMLTTSRHDEVYPCGLDRLCGNNEFAFSLLRSYNFNLDIIGFYHPYCRIQGLRYCKVTKRSDYEKNTLVASWNMVTCRVFGFLKIFKICNRESVEGINIYESYRNSVIKDTFNAPFWTNGGTLFVHMPLPHPPGKIVGNDLLLDYIDNIDRAGDYLERLLMKLKSNFGNDFKILVTSDHPLRASYWCNIEQYKNKRCEERLPSEKPYVSLILASPKMNAFKEPNSMIGIFSGSSSELN
jgi:hypothetical protein